MSKSGTAVKSKLTQRELFIVIGATVLVSVIVLGRFVVIPAEERWDSAKAKTVMLQSEIARINDLTKQRDQAQARMALRFGESVGRALTDVETTSVTFPKALADVLGKGKMKYQSLELQRVREMREVPGIALVSFSVRGSIRPQDITNLLNAFRQGEQVILIDRMTISNSSGGGDGGGRSRGGGGRGGQWNVTLTISTPAISPKRERRASLDREVTEREVMG